MVNLNLIFESQAQPLRGMCRGNLFASPLGSRKVSAKLTTDLAVVVMRATYLTDILETADEYVEQLEQYADPGE